ncbi:MAG: membrane protein insertase YidC, partial [Crocinitomicaceae bacterium]|nr:membrane protein insertase YidC [Crocinitomicaceae bacterium]
MDRNTLTGLVLIGLLLTVFTIINKPSEEELKQQEAEVAKAKEAKAKSKEKDAVTIDTAKSSNENLDLDEQQNTAENKTELADSLFTRKTDKFTVEFSTKGGQISALYLNDYKSYNNYSKGANEALCLFTKGDHLTSYSFFDGDQLIQTKNLNFKLKNESNAKVILEAPYKTGAIRQTYKFGKDSYNIDYKVEFIELNGIAKDNIQLSWQTSFLQSEKLLSEQRRVSTICYDEQEEGFDYLSETSEDNKDFENEVNWIAYKQSYFSSFLAPKTPFQKKGTSIKVSLYEEDTGRDSTHIKDFSSILTLNLDPNSNNTASFSWYFGPNDYELLNEYNENYDDILNFGWGLFRWINLYAVQPVFSFLLSLGFGLGLSIFLLTLFIKTALMPVQWKMFVSSVKMRILKPKTEALNAKYPNKDDAMKKQMEMMTLYKESGASPLSGCLPMLIQMPILLAVFRFFPSAFELRQQSFLWADDLSSYDSILDLGFSIPLYGDHISLFTLLMSATTLLYTVMNSGNVQQPTQPGMPNMKLLMYIFPVMMIFFF